MSLLDGNVRRRHRRGTRTRRGDRAAARRPRARRGAVLDLPSALPRCPTGWEASRASTCATRHPFATAFAGIDRGRRPRRRRRHRARLGRHRRRPTSTAWDEVFAVNVRGMVATLKHAAPVLARRRRGRPDRLAQLLARRPEHRELRREQARRARDRPLGGARPRPPGHPRQRARPGPDRDRGAARADGRPRARARGSRSTTALAAAAAQTALGRMVDASTRSPTRRSSSRAASRPGSPASCFRSTRGCCDGSRRAGPCSSPAPRAGSAPPPRPRSAPAARPSSRTTARYREGAEEARRRRCRTTRKRIVQADFAEPGSARTFWRERARARARGSTPSSSTPAISPRDAVRRRRRGRGTTAGTSSCASTSSSRRA